MMQGGTSSFVEPRRDLEEQRFRSSSPSVVDGDDLPRHRVTEDVSTDVLRSIVPLSALTENHDLGRKPRSSRRTEYHPHKGGGSGWPFFRAEIIAAVRDEPEALLPIDGGEGLSTFYD